MEEDEQKEKGEEEKDGGSSNAVFTDQDKMYI